MKVFEPALIFATHLLFARRAEAQQPVYCSDGTAQTYFTLGEPNSVRYDEGKKLNETHNYANDPSECYPLCDAIPGCASITICLQHKSCAFREQIIWEGDRTDPAGGGCQTHFKCTTRIDPPPRPPPQAPCPSAEPGKVTRPGAQWTLEEALIVKAKVWQALGGVGRRHIADRIDARYATECVLNIGENLDARERTVSRVDGQEGTCNFKQNDAAGFTHAKLLRLFFHDCFLYQDCSGGCDGCLNFQGMFTRYLGTKREEMYPSSGDNNDLAYTADGLELIYQEKDFPPGAPALTQSLADSGKSRADLWAFAGLVGVEYGINYNDIQCTRASTISDSFEYPSTGGPELEHNILMALGSKCTIGKPYMQFLTGRQDCQNVGPQRAYEAVDHERHPDNHFTGPETVNWFKANFGQEFLAKDVVAIMGAHSVGGLHTSTMFAYTWTRTQSNNLNNQYYLNMMEAPTYMLSGNLGVPADDPIGSNLGNTDQWGQYTWHTGAGNAPGKAVWRPIVEKNRKYGGPFCWTHIFEFCPICYKQKNGQWKNRGVNLKGGLFLSDIFYTDECCKICYEDKVYDERCLTWTANDQMGLNPDVGLYYDFQTTSYGKPIGCPGLKQNDWETEYTWLLNDYWPPGGARMRQEHRCPKQEFDAGEGTPLYVFVERYANDQDIWVHDFLMAIRKMQHNGYGQGDLVQGPDVFNSGVTCEKIGGVFTCTNANSACAAFCAGCATNGAGMCDTCYDGYELIDATKTCQEAAPPPTPPWEQPACPVWCAGNKAPWSLKCYWAGMCDSCGYCTQACSEFTTQGTESMPGCPINRCVWTDSRCQACAANCYSCVTNGQGKCDVCNNGFTLSDAKLCEAHVPTPPPAACETWCNHHTSAWADKCKWPPCSICNACPAPAPTPPPTLPPTPQGQCKNWCNTHTSHWQDKCTYNGCNGCVQCEALSTPAPPAYWPQYGNEKTKCLNATFEDVSRTQQECQQLAVQRAHNFYQYREDNSRCATSSTCDTKDTTGPWKIFKAPNSPTQPAPEPEPEPTPQVPASAPAVAPAPGPAQANAPAPAPADDTAPAPAPAQAVAPGSVPADDKPTPSPTPDCEENLITNDDCNFVGSARSRSISALFTIEVLVASLFFIQ